MRAAFHVGGRCAGEPVRRAVGHGCNPIGCRPACIGQIAEITRQRRGEAGLRQQPGATTGLAHMVGVGAVLPWSMCWRGDTP